MKTVEKTKTSIRFGRTRFSDIPKSVACLLILLLYFYFPTVCQLTMLPPACYLMWLPVWSQVEPGPVQWHGSPLLFPTSCFTYNISVIKIVVRHYVFGSFHEQGQIRGGRRRAAERKLRRNGEYSLPPSPLHSLPHFKTALGEVVSTK